MADEAARLAASMIVQRALLGHVCLLFRTFPPTHPVCGMSGHVSYVSVGGDRRVWALAEQWAAWLSILRVGAPVPRIAAPSLFPLRYVIYSSPRLIAHFRGG